MKNNRRDLVSMFAVPILWGVFGWSLGMVAVSIIKHVNKEQPVNIDIKQLKAECDFAIEQARREGWKGGYLFTSAVNPYDAGLLANAWREGRKHGEAARRAEQKAKEQP